MKKIPYTVVKTGNHVGTIYYKTTSVDTKFVLKQCKEIVDLYDLLVNETDVMSTCIINDLTNPNKKLPKLSQANGGGYNSPYSMCKGVIDNFNTGQYFFTYKQAPGLELAFKLALDNFSKHLTADSYTLEEISFYEVSTLPVTASLNRSTVVPVQQETITNVPDTSTTFGDLFEVVMVQQPIFEVRRKV